MSVQNGNPANQTTFNTSFMSREEDTNTIGRVDLDNALAESGPTLANVQRELNGQASFVGDTPEGAYDRKPTWASDSIGTPNQAVKDRVDSIQGAVETNQTAISELETDVTDIRSALGISDGDTDMGTYTGSIITDNVDQVTINQELEDAIEDRILLSEKGAANGVATLDSGGRLPVGQLPTSAVEYQGAWNASTNTPTLIDGTGDNGDLYRVSVAGTQDLGSGSVSYGVGDAIIYNGTIWQRIPSDSAVESVNGQSGIVVLDTDDISEGATNLYHTDARVDARIALASIDDLADVDTTTNPPATNEALIWDGTNWVPGEAVGGSGQGKKNYFEGGDFEQDIALASVYDDGGSFVDGTGGTPSAITILQNTGGPLAGAADLEIYKTTVSGIGEGVTLLSSTIDTIDLGKDLFLELSINATDTNYTSGNYVLRAYDVTSSAIIPVVPIANLGDNGEILKAQTTIYAKVLCNSTTQQVRVSLHCNADPVPGNDFYVYVDQAVLSPSAVLVGSVITEWQQFTMSITSTGTSPTKATTPLNDKAYWRRVGDSMEIQYYYRNPNPATGATAGTGTYLFNMPSGYTINTSKIETAGGGLVSVGSATAYIGTGSINLTGSVTVNDPSRFLVIVGDNTQGDIAVGATFLPLSNNSLIYSFRATVPVTQFASAGNLLSANEASYLTVKVAAAIQTGQALTADTTDISFGVVSLNTHNAWITNQFTAPYTTTYDIEGLLRFTTSSNRAVSAYVNGVLRKTLSTNAYSGVISKFSGNVFLNEGEILSFRIDTNETTVTGTQSNNWITIEASPDFTVFGVHGQSEIRSIQSSFTAATTSGAYVSLTGNGITVLAGEWKLTPIFNFERTSGLSNATRYRAIWSESQNTLTTLGTTIPVNFSIGPTAFDIGFNSSQELDRTIWTGVPIVIRPNNSATVFLNAIIDATTPANFSTRVWILAERIK